MNFRSIILTFILILFYGSPHAADQPTRITLGHEDQNAYPWVVKDINGYTGLDLELIDLLQAKIGIKIKTVGYPWTRALVTMQKGNLDGVFAASYKPERKKYGSYPLKDGELDGDRRIHTSGYSLYILEGSKLKFDGDKFENLVSGIGVTDIGVQRSFSIIPSLKKFDVNLNDSSSDPDHILYMLFHKRIAAAAIQAARADQIIAAKPLFQKKIIKYKTNKKPFHQKPYFIMLSHQFMKRYPGFSEKFWNAVKEVRNSSEYRQRETEFYDL
jgi:polar amino acid transport system substrate-binding protein